MDQISRSKLESSTSVDGRKFSITGISGRYPQSANIDEFAENLFAGIDMVTESDARWPKGIYDLPQRSGVLKEVDKFDAQFFNIGARQVNNMDPQIRIMLECVYEAIVDAGYNPSELRGTNTGVFMGISFSDAHIAFGSDSSEIEGYAMTGCTLSMLANRISFFFDFKGPSFVVDTACSSTFMAAYNAMASLRANQCQQAIVGGSHLLLRPQGSLQFKLLNMLSPDGSCKSFDTNANGYVRAETIGAFFIQPLEFSRRSYAQIIDIKTNTDGSKDNGITYPNGERQKKLMEQVLANTRSLYDNEKIVYYEAHGTGTQAGDPQEVNAAAEVYCSDQFTSLPLLIGSVKSNCGHSEPSSGIASISKVLISIQKGRIPANLHFNEPNSAIGGLLDRRLKVVDQNMDLQPGLIALNSSGFGGANVHMILRSTRRIDAHQCTSKNKNPLSLIIFSSRTREGVKKGLNHLTNHFCPSLHCLLEPNLSNDFYTHPFRGYKLIRNKSETIRSELDQVPMVRDRQIWYVFSGMGTQWPKMARELFKLRPFEQSMENSRRVLLKTGIDLFKILLEDDEAIFDSILHIFVSVAAIQIALCDCLTSAGIIPDKIIGHSVGEVVCAYADGCFSAEETLLAAYSRGVSIQQTKEVEGSMAAVAMSWDDCARCCPEGVVPACHNSDDSVTISGNKTQVDRFVADLQSKNIFAKEVDSCGIAFHSPSMSNVATNLQQRLQSFLGPDNQKRLRSQKWLSTSVPVDQWQSVDFAKYSGAQYHANNLSQWVSWLASFS